MVFPRLLLKEAFKGVTRSTYAVNKVPGVAQGQNLGRHPASLTTCQIQKRYCSSRGARVGPERILPANSLSTTYPDGAVEIRFSDLPNANNTPNSIWKMFNDTVGRVPDRTALAVKRNDEWVKWTYREYLDDAKSVAKAFIKLGLKPHYGVGILGFNSPEWHLSALGSVLAGGLTAGIYTTNSVDAVRYVAEHSKAQIMVVEDEEQYAKIESCWDRLENLTTVIQYTGYPRSPGVLSWQKLIEIGRQESDDILMERLQMQAVNQCCTLIYTSGTTGNPKGVMLSQDNLTWTAARSQEIYKWRYDEEVIVSYLPLSHVAGTYIDIYLAMFGGVTVYFADKMALQGTLLKTLQEAKPTLFFGVPRVYEKIKEKLQDAGKLNSGVKKSIAEKAKAAALQHWEDVIAGRGGNSLGYRMANQTVLSQVKKALGFENCWGYYSSAAPLPEEVFKYFLSLDMPIQELLGSSETTGPQTASTLEFLRTGSVGICYPGWEVGIINPEPDTGLGEICTRGRNCCMGYMWEEGKTKDLIDSEGWLHSGDLGRYDEDKFLIVGGRSKELIVTGGGENVAPIPIEDAIKAQLKDIVSNVMVIGDKKKHLAAIITLRTELDSQNLPTNDLHSNVLKFISKLGSDAKTVTDLVEEDNDEVREEILRAIQKVNRKAISNAQKVHKFMIAPRDFSLHTGELTPTMKLKRHVVTELYAEQIKEMYEHETQSSMW